MKQNDHISDTSRGVTVRYSGQFLFVRPPCEELQRRLQTFCHLPLPHAEHGCEFARVPLPLCQEVSDQGEPELCCWAGLGPAVQKTLTGAGYQARLKGKRFAALAPPEFGQFPARAPHDANLLECIRRKDRAIVRYEPGAASPVWLIAQIALAWPHLTIAVAVTRIDEARQLRNRLRKYLPGVVAVSSRNHPGEEVIGQVVVATYTALSHPAIQIEWRNILIALNATEAVNRRGRDCLADAHRARLYGLLDRGVRLAPRDHDLVRRLFGFEEVVIPRPGHVLLPVEVVWFRHGGSKQLSGGLGPLQVKRQGLWRNEVRHRRIARLARLLRAQDAGVLAEHFPEIAASRCLSQQPSVVVLVENVEHGLSLARHLPEWPLIADSEPYASGRPGAQLIVQPSRVSAANGRGFGAVVTFAGLNQLTLDNVGVVIRADGGVGLPPAIAGLSRKIIYGKNNLPRLGALEPGPRLLLVDLDDRHHPRLRRWSRQRRTAYRQHGWYGPGVDPVQARVEDFLDSRPQDGASRPN